MLTNISFLWNKCKAKVKTFNDMKYDIDWGHSYEEEQIAQKKDRKWTTKLRKYQLEAFSFFGLLIIELDRLIQENIKDSDPTNFEILEECEVYFRHERIKINKIKKMIKFIRHAYCHPESIDLRLDPYISDKLKKRPDQQDRSYHRTSLLKDKKNNFFAQMGGGKLYFADIDRSVRLVNNILRKK